MSGEKSFKPSQKRLDQARKRGQVPKSPLFTQVFAMGSGLLALKYGLGATWVRNKILLEYLWLEGLADLGASFELVAKLLLKDLGVLLFVIAGVALLSELLQVGFRIELSLLLPRADRLSPAKGFEKMLKGLGDLAPLITKLVIGVAVFSIAIWQIVLLVGMENRSIVSFACQKVISCGILTLIGFGIIDLLLKRRKYLRNLRMSITELRQEAKEDEGDPLIRAMRRSLHESLSMQDIVRKVRSSKVIVVERLAKRHAVT